MCMLSRLSHVWLCAILWTVAHHLPLSKGFSRQEYWIGLPCSPPGDLHNQEIELVSVTSPALAGRFFTTSATWKPRHTHTHTHTHTHICLFFFRFFSLIGYYETLNIFPCATQGTRSLLCTYFIYSSVCTLISNSCFVPPRFPLW